MEKHIVSEEIGLDSGCVRLVPHQAIWKTLFEQEKERLLGVLRPYILDLQHIGSTSIPGIAAKPILDIGVAVQSFTAGFACIDPLQRLGYRYFGENGVPGRHYFDYGSPCRVHLHIFAQDSPEWEAHILFRDYLTHHPDAAAQYDALKRDLAGKYPDERERYTEAKGPFIQSVVERARMEVQ